MYLQLYYFKTQLVLAVQVHSNTKPMVMIMVITCGFIFNLFCATILMDTNLALFYHNLRFFYLKMAQNSQLSKGHHVSSA